MVIGDFACVYGTLCDWNMAAGSGSWDEGLHRLWKVGKRLFHFGNHIRRKISGICPRISERFMGFIQTLCQFESLVSGISKHPVGIPLKTGQIIELRRELTFVLCITTYDCGSFSFDLVNNCLCFFLCFQMCI